MFSKLIRFILRRKAFKGQFRLFAWLFHNKKLPSFKTTGKPLNGNFMLNLDTENYIDAWIYYAGDYESFLKKNFKKYIRPGNVVLDIGANIGFHTLYFAELTGADGRVIAFEPMPVNFEALKANVALNNFSNITVVNSALGNEEGKLDIYLDPAMTNPGAYNLFASGEANTHVDIKIGDKALREVDAKRIDIIKIDVEGYEIQVLKGLSDTLEQDRPIVFFEYERDFLLSNKEDPAQLFDIFNGNYDLYSINGSGKVAPFQYHPEIAGAQLLALPA